MEEPRGVAEARIRRSCVTPIGFIRCSSNPATRLRSRSSFWLDAALERHLAGGHPAVVVPQHKEVEALFDRVEKATTVAQRMKLFEQIADALAVHWAIEEKISYPAVYGAKTRDVLLEVVEEDHACKRIKTDVIALPATGEM